MRNNRVEVFLLWTVLVGAVAAFSYIVGSYEGSKEGYRQYKLTHVDYPSAFDCRIIDGEYFMFLPMDERVWVPLVLQDESVIKDCVIVNELAVVRHRSGNVSIMKRGELMERIGKEVANRNKVWVVD